VTIEPTPAEAGSFEIDRLVRALSALANPECCRGAGVSVFRVLGRDGRPTGEEVRLCDACGRRIEAGADVD